MDFVVVVEKAEDGSFSAYVPDLPGCVSCGDTPEEARQLIREAIDLHIDSLQRHGDPVPAPSAIAYTVHAGSC